MRAYYYYYKLTRRVTGYVLLPYFCDSWCTDFVSCLLYKVTKFLIKYIEQQ